MYPAAPHHMIRPRLTDLMRHAMQYSAVIVCASAGCGKTRAVSDFASASQASTVWVQLFEQDNLGSRFWENFCNSIAPVDALAAREYMELGFPDTEDKLDRYVKIRDRGISNQEYMVVYDDVHLLSDPTVIRYLERSIRTLPQNVTAFLLCREYPKINIMDLEIDGLVFNITEDDLNFTYNELVQYTSQQGVAVTPSVLSKVFDDSGGWAFAIGLIIRFLKKSPRYVGYVQESMRENIFNLMQAEAWGAASEGLKRFLARLSLINHLSANLVADLAGADSGLLAELEQQNAYIRRDNFAHTYMIHHLFLGFLRTKQAMLTADEIRDTYARAAVWCAENDFKVDALGYYEKVGDYKGIVAIFDDLPAQIPQDIALYSREIFENAPEGICTEIPLFLPRYWRVLLSLGLISDVILLAKDYEQKILEIREPSVFHQHLLACTYVILGKARMLAGIVDDRYDFDGYYEKAGKILSEYPMITRHLTSYHLAPWISMAGSARKNAPQEFCKALSNVVSCLSDSLKKPLAGLDHLCRGELLLYQGDISAAETTILQALEQARSHGQFENIHRALLYLIRIAVLQGNYVKMTQNLKDLEDAAAPLQYDANSDLLQIAAGWYHYLLRQPQQMPGWIKDRFTPYIHTVFIENYGNQIRTRYCYLTHNYPPLLAYIQELKQRESVLFYRIEMLVLEACTYFHMKKKDLAHSTLHEAYITAAPNDIVLPFIELGKDMRTLSNSALKDPLCKIPHAWLLNIHRRSTTYSKHQAQVITTFKKVHNYENSVNLSALELAILRDLVKGLSRSEIATHQKLSINTINSSVTHIYTKLNAHNIVDAVRIAIERRLL